MLAVAGIAAQAQWTAWKTRMPQLAQQGNRLK
jgi:hypothetical protein